MNALLLRHLAQHERDITSTLTPPNGVPSTGSFADINGGAAERAILRLLADTLPLKAAPCRHLIIFDAHDNHTRQAVDAVVLADQGLRTTIRAMPSVPADSVRAALEIKLRFDSNSLCGVLAQLASIKKLRRATGRITTGSSVSPPPRGNIFCGALFMLPGKRTPFPSGEKAWETHLGKVLASWGKIWKDSTPAACDGGRYPNFLWYWNHAFVLRRYLRDDWQLQLPPHVYESEPFMAPRADGSLDHVFYQVWERDHDCSGFSPLAFALWRLVLQANEFVREEIDWGEYFFNRT